MKAPLRRSVTFDPPGRPTPKKPRTITLPTGPRRRVEAAVMPSGPRRKVPAANVARGVPAFHEGVLRFQDAPDYLRHIPTLFANPYWRARVGRGLRNAFASDDNTLKDPGYLQQAAGLVLADLRRGVDRVSLDTEDEEALAGLDDFEPMPEDARKASRDVDPVHDAFTRYWKQVELLPEYERQLEIVQKACEEDPHLFDWFKGNLEDIRRTFFVAGNSTAYFTRPNPTLLIRVLREAAKEEFPETEFSADVSRDARTLRALWRLARVNYALLCVAGETAAVMGVIVAWYPSPYPPLSESVPDWEGLTRTLRERLVATDEGRRALVLVETLARTDERLQARAVAANLKNRRALKAAGDKEVPYIQHVWVNPRIRPMAVDLSLVYAFNQVVTYAGRTAFYLGTVHGECPEFSEASDFRVVKDNEEPPLRAMEIIDFGPEDPRYSVAGQRISDPAAFFADLNLPEGEVLRALEEEVFLANASGDDDPSQSRFAWTKPYITDDLLTQIQGADDEAAEEEDFDALEAAIADQPADEDED